MNYLLNWYKVYKTEGLKDQSADIKGAVKEYRKEVDSVKTFLEDALEKTDLETDKISTVKLLEYHNRWAKTRLSSQKFGKRLKSNDIETTQSRVDGSKVMAIVGYIFNEDFINTTECQITHE